MYVNVRLCLRRPWIHLVLSIVKRLEDALGQPQNLVLKCLPTISKGEIVSKATRINVRIYTYSWISGAMLHGTVNP